jgi:hypothetical protein
MNIDGDNMEEGIVENGAVEGAPTKNRNTRMMHDTLVAKILEYMKDLKEPMTLGMLARELGSSTQSVSHNVQLMYHKGELPEHIGLKQVGAALMIFPKSGEIR